MVSCVRRQIDTAHNSINTRHCTKVCQANVFVLRYISRYYRCSMKFRDNWQLEAALETECPEAAFIGCAKKLELLLN